MIETYDSDTNTSSVEPSPKSGGALGYWTDGYDNAYMFVKVVYRASASSAPDWTKLLIAGIPTDDASQDNYLNFLGDDDIFVGDPGSDQWWSLCRILLVKDAGVPQAPTLVWAGVDFSVVVAYWDDASIPADTDFKGPLTPAPVAVYLIDASGSMAAHVQDIADVQLDKIRAWAETPSEPSRRVGVIVLKGGAFNVFPSSWDIASVPDAGIIVGQAKPLLSSGAGNSPIGTLVAMAQGLVSEGHFTEPQYLGNGALILVTDGKENGGSSPKIKVDDAAALATNDLRMWLGKYGYKLIVIYYDSLPTDIWDAWQGVELFQDINIEEL